MNMQAVLLAVAFGYLLGSIPFGLLLTRAAGLGDIRTIGSGNIGATNVLRTGNEALAAATLLLDAGKAAAAVLIARYLWGEDAALLAGLAAFVGHILPVWLSFRGGKGVAVYIGVLLGLCWASPWDRRAKVEFAQAAARASYSPRIATVPRASFGTRTCAPT